MFRFVLAAVVLRLISPAFAGGPAYSLVEDFSGANFFSGFRYNESVIDRNVGNVHFVSQSAALSANLTYVDDNGHAIIKVDNTTNGTGDTTFGRDTVYLISNNPLSIDSLVIMDVNHIPFGCSVWPGFFTQGQNWPAQGEIDIVENVNQATVNQYSLHVGDTCNWSNSSASVQTGSTTTTNCTTDVPNNMNTGCIVQETKSNSFGSSFAANGGGIFAMQWNTKGISVWFFSRAQGSPGDINATFDHPDPTTWGVPSAFYAASGCDPSTSFGPQFLSLDIDLCGSFAGLPAVFDETCAGVAPNCSFMVPDPSNYANAYWDINYIRTFNSTSDAINSAFTSMLFVSTAASVFSSLMLLS